MASARRASKIRENRLAVRFHGRYRGTKPSRFRVRAVMSCCGTRNLLLAIRSPNFDRCHSPLLAFPATGGARRAPHFDTLPYSIRRSNFLRNGTIISYFPSDCKPFFEFLRISSHFCGGFRFSARLRRFRTAKEGDETEKSSGRGRRFR